MRILKAKIYVSQTPGNTEYRYSPVWLANKERIPAIIYPNDRTDQGTDAKGTYQIVYPCVPDDVAQALIDDPETDITECPRAEVAAYVEKHHPKKNMILDNVKVLTILSKSARGEKLSKDEIDAIDPKHPAEGINESKFLHEIIEERYAATYKKT